MLLYFIGIQSTLDKKQESWLRMDLFNENGRIILISVFSNESRMSMFLANLVARFLSIGILNCCTPTTISMCILGITQLFVALHVYTAKKVDACR